MDNDIFGYNRAYKYSVQKLIELVKSRPIIWDSTRADFRAFTSKERAWREIYEALDDKYRSADEKTRAEIGLKITAKWRNIRDAFMRSYKKRAHQSKVKKYMYHDRLSFMLKLLGPDGTSGGTQSPKRPLSSNSESLTAEGSLFYDVDDPLVADIKLEPSEETMEYSDPVTAMLKVEIDDDSLLGGDDKRNDVDLRAGIDVDSNSKGKREEQTCRTGVPLDEDEAFFHSILSLVRDMNGDEKLEFRMAVLRQIHETRSRRRGTGSTKPKEEDQS